MLDNAEACKAPALYANRLNRIDLSGGTRVLMTSRAEWREARSQKRHDLHAPSPEAAVKILQAMVEAEPPAFTLDGHAPAIAKAARYHPRLLQYAVHWLNDRPPDAVERALTTLKGTDAQEALQEMILKTVEQAWAQPGGEEAIRALRRLAVCWGGFIFEAAEAIVGAGFDARQIALLKQWACWLPKTTATTWTRWWRRRWARTRTRSRRTTTITGRWRTGTTSDRITWAWTPSRPTWRSPSSGR